MSIFVRHVVALWGQLWEGGGGLPMFLLIIAGSITVEKVLCHWLDGLDCLL